MYVYTFEIIEKEIDILMNEDNPRIDRNSCFTWKQRREEREESESLGILLYLFVLYYYLFVIIYVSLLFGDR